MRFGTAVHMAILEPEKFVMKYNFTELRKNTKAYKELSADNPEVEFLNNSDWRAIQEIRIKFDANEHASELIAHCDRREELVEGEIQDMPFRGFVDAMSKNCVIDIKTTQDGSPDAFGRSVYNFGYHLQAAIYKELTGIDDYFIIAIENSSPYNVTVYKLSQDYIDKGYSVMNKGINDFKLWDGEERGYKQMLELQLPKWAK